MSRKISKIRAMCRLEKLMIRSLYKEESQPRLHFETKSYTLKDGQVVEEYIIPESQKDQVLDQLYPYLPVPALDERMFDIHEGKTFRVGDFKVIREQDFNFLVSPYYHLSGGTVIDWSDMEEEPAENDFLQMSFRVIKSELAKNLTTKSSKCHPDCHYDLRLGA